MVSPLLILTGIIIMIIAYVHVYESYYYSDCTKTQKKLPTLFGMDENV